MTTDQDFAKRTQYRIVQDNQQMRGGCSSAVEPARLTRSPMLRAPSTNKEGPALRPALPLSSRGPAPQSEVTPSVKRIPRTNRGSRVPATAAIDNETLDHLLSVVNDPSNVGDDS